MFIVVAPPILMSLSLCIEETTFSTEATTETQPLRRQSVRTANYYHLNYTKTPPLTSRKQNTTSTTCMNSGNLWARSSIQETERFHLRDPYNPFYCNSLPSAFSSVLPSLADGSSSPPPVCDAPPPAWSTQSRLLNHSSHTQQTSAPHMSSFS